MNRMRFGRWGADLDADGFARAFAAVGVLAAASQQRGEVLPPERASALLSELSTQADARDKLLRWANPLLHPGWSGAAEAIDAADLAAAWPGAAVRFAMAAEDFADDGLEPTWVTKTLTTPAVGGRSAALLSQRALGGGARGARLRWEWPLRVGFLPDGASDLLHRDAMSLRRRVPLLGSLITLHRVGASPSCDLLLVPMTLRQALPAVLGIQVSSAIVVLTGTLTGRWRHVEPLLDALRSVTKASVVGFASTVDPVRWLQALVEDLATDAPFDAAFSSAGQRTAGGAALLVAEEPFLGVARMSQQAAQVLAEADVLSRAAALAGAETPAVDGVAMSTLARAAQLVSEQHAAGAAEVAGAEQRVRESLDVVEPRWLQARVFAAVGGPVRRVATFEPGALHAVDVRIGLSDADWQALSTTVPTEELPEQDAPHRLTVVLTEATLLDGPLTGELLLPRVGSSAPTTFLLRIKPDTTIVDAHLIVVYGNRVLQTARLRGGVAGRTDEPHIRLEPETSVRLRTSDLAERRRFDAALVLDSGAGGTARVTALVDAKAVVVDLDDSDLAKTSERIRARFEEIVEAPEDFTSLHSEGTRDLLLFLATRGALLRHALVADFLGPALSAAERLQLVAARPEASFPLEFCYDLPAPDPDAQVCPSAERALAAGTDCPGPHGVTVVCPSGFWALTKVIERHAHQPVDLSRPDRGYLVRSEPTSRRHRIDLGGRTLFAASDRVDGFASGTLERLGRQLSEATGGRATSAATWEDWLTRVEADQPSVLLLLPHTTYEHNLEVYGLEIGGAEQLWGSQIAPGHVHGGDDHPALVVLLGCATADGPITYEDFPARFRRCGAEIFVGTLPKILGRHAAPVGGLLVELLAEHGAGREGTFGDLMRELRRRCLARGEPLALSLVAYGDADWVLGSAPEAVPVH